MTAELCPQICTDLQTKKFASIDKIIKSNGGKFGKKKAKSMLYNTITEQLSILCKKRSQELGLKLRDVLQDNLHKKTQRTEKTINYSKKWI
jgi:hypothetical protein